MDRTPARATLLWLCLLLAAPALRAQQPPAVQDPPAPTPATAPATTPAKPAQATPPGPLLQRLGEATAEQPALSPTAGPRVAFETSMGRIVFELYPDKAPKTVANFLAYVEDGHYNGTIFHRVIGNFLVQGGAYTPDMQQKPERAPVASEAANGLSNLRGTLAAARRSSDPNSATAQFFINTVDNRPLDWRGDASAESAGYCVFGRVVEGLDVLDRIRVVPTGARAPFPADVPVTPVLVERAVVLAD
jgi:cyclophilin family peptidyl-prolyl cis-trans isomerase